MCLFGCPGRIDHSDSRRRARPGKMRACDQRSTPSSVHMGWTRRIRLRCDRSRSQSDGPRSILPEELLVGNPATGSSCSSARIVADGGTAGFRAVNNSQWNCAVLMVLLGVAEVYSLDIPFRLEDSRSLDSLFRFLRGLKRPARERPEDVKTIAASCSWPRCRILLRRSLRRRRPILIVKVTDMVAPAVPPWSPRPRQKLKFEEALAKRRSWRRRSSRIREKLEISTTRSARPEEARRKARKLTYATAPGSSWAARTGGLDQRRERPAAETGELIPSGQHPHRRKPPPHSTVRWEKRSRRRTSGGPRLQRRARASLKASSPGNPRWSRRRRREECSTCLGKGSMNVNRGGIAHGSLPPLPRD